jgi:glycosyltransferase involved in cell wall biosynthesis
VKVTLLTETFAKNMGYLENVLPKYLSQLGVEMHVITTDLPPYYHEKSASKSYEGFAQHLQAGTVEQVEGYALHVLGYKKTLGYMRMSGLRKRLREIAPDVVQTMSAVGWIPLDAALGRFSLGYKLFTASHYHSSVFPLASKMLPPWSAERLHCLVARAIPGRLTSLAAEKCYAITEDCADVATRYFGVPKNKVEVCALGVDTELFHPLREPSEFADRAALRRRLGFDDSKIVCIYTGRFTADKNPLLLVRAIEELCKMGKPYAGLFVGNGTQAADIATSAGSVTHPFVPVSELGALYRAADIGIWPAQESLSMLDAAACGLPIVANHTMDASERVQGNGMTYRLNDQADMVRVLLDLVDTSTRRRLGEIGALKMAREFSWESIARRRMRDYESALRSGKSSGEKHPSKELLGRVE